MHIPDILVISEDAFNEIQSVTGRKAIDYSLTLTKDDIPLLEGSGTGHGMLFPLLSLFLERQPLLVGYRDTVKEGRAFLVRDRDGSLLCFGERPRLASGKWVSPAGHMTVTDPVVILSAFDLEPEDGPREVMMAYHPSPPDTRLPTVEILQPRIDGRSDCAFYMGEIARAAVGGKVFSVSAGEMRLDDLELDVRYANSPDDKLAEFLKTDITDDTFEENGDRFEFREGNWFYLTLPDGSTTGIIDTYEDAISVLIEAAKEEMDNAR